MAAFVLTISLGALMLVPCCLKRGGPTARLIAAPFSRHSGAGSIPSARMLASGGGGSGAAAASSAEQRGRYVSSIEDAAASLRAGGLVAFPTETVYGLGAHAFDADAVASIFTVKGRPRSDPLIVHVPSPEAAEELVRLDDDGLAVMRQLAAAFWPGPLTLVARACPELPPAVTAGTGFVGVRCPAHARATELLRAAGVPVAAPSANRFGHVSPTKPEHVMDDLGGHEIMVLLPSPTPSPSSAAAACDVGIESTVLKVDGEAKELLLLRRGGVPEAELARWLAARRDDLWLHDARAAAQAFGAAARGVRAGSAAAAAAARIGGDTGPACGYGGGADRTGHASHPLCAWISFLPPGAIRWRRGYGGGGGCVGLPG